ncbi:MAG: ATP-grasp domain-containing protein [Ruminococcus sp.]|jgi:glutathione synthase/RimK-type ligase-like ATP-grasp enzyme
MGIGILYESEEWSTYALEKDIKDLGVPVKLICMEKNVEAEDFRGCELVLNRVFASAGFRGHQKSLEQTPQVLEQLKKLNIPVINPPAAHFYETDKALAADVLKKKRVSVPEIYGILEKNRGNCPGISYPCILKPNCGGRTTYTYILRDEEDLQKAYGEIPDIPMLAEEYIEPVRGYLTRIEVIGGECRLIVKRSVAENGLSAYHLGSRYQLYPECDEKLKETALYAMEILEIEAGSMDVIETDHGFFIIDVNAVSNASQDNTEMFQFDLMLETAKYAVKKYKKKERMFI